MSAIRLGTSRWANSLIVVVGRKGGNGLLSSPPGSGCGSTIVVGSKSGPGHSWNTIALKFDPLPLRTVRTEEQMCVCVSL